MPNGPPHIKVQRATPPATETTSLLSPVQQRRDEEDRPPSPAHSITNRFFEHVAEGIQEQDRQRFTRELTRYVSFVWAIVACLCAGSITAYSLYAPLFHSRLKYTQIQVNTVSIVAEVSLYLPVPLIGLLCDRRGPAWSSLLASVLFGAGYFVAAFTYQSGPPAEHGGNGWPFSVMCLAFVGIGIGTCSMYLGAVTTCAKNFGRGKHKGFALAAPIASFGLGGMWQSQVGARLLVERKADGSKGDVDVFKYFLFLAGLLLGVGLIGSLLLRVVDEEALVVEAVEELSRSGVLDEERPGSARPPLSRGHSTYGAMDSQLLNKSTMSTLSKAEERELKTWLLNGETRRFLADPTMWLLAGGFFLVTGPGEAFINNLGTLIGTLYPGEDSELEPTTPATHVGIVAVTSTVARILAGTLSDLFSPSPPRHHHHHRQQRPHSSSHPGAESLESSVNSLDPFPPIDSSTSSTNNKFTISRMTLLLSSTALLSVALVLLASGLVQNRAASLFWLASALVGTGYGAAFSLVPIVISCVWGLENFGTNWGIVAVAPAPGAAVFGWLYAIVYQRATYVPELGDGEEPGGEENCYGAQCYMSTFWAMAGAVWIALVIWTLAWRRWKSKGIDV